MNIGVTRVMLRLSGTTPVTNDKVIIRVIGYETGIDKRFSDRTGTVFESVLVLFRVAIIFSH